MQESFFSKLPRWFRILLLVVSIITMVYWVALITYKMLCAIRVIGAFIFEKRNYWTFLFCIAILIFGTLLVAQLFLGLDPVGKIWEYILNQYEQLKETIVNKIIG